ncbi:MAG: bifunctional phosphoglucose/phosphomannose isomerase [Ardenticatenia bacterium]|nr:bifunctional phosphoglucose/phosphomannose isomerase [Ardenticatenia bacterium]
MVLDSPLDHMTDLVSFDPDGMLECIRDLPAQVEAAWALVNRLALPGTFGEHVANVLVIGMGGSAIGADLVAGIVADHCRVPIGVHRGYGVPAWVDEGTLVIASSYSGNTEETLSGWKAARRRGAQCMAITTGGALADAAREAKAPLLLFDYQAQPRAALGYSFTLIYGVLARLGLIADPTMGLRAAVATLRATGTAWEPDVPTDQNLAKQLALWYAEALPVIFGAEHLSAVARRWTTQVNENSKAWAVWAEMPELNHNVVVGLAQPEPVRQVVRVAQLRSKFYHERVKRRFDITGQLLEEAGVRWRDVEAVGNTPLAEMLWTIWLGDYVSYYLAYLYHTDPSPVEPIRRLKASLAQE